jgi:hypothetical protein
VITPDESFGRAVYNEFRGFQPDATADWEAEGPEIQAKYVRMAMAGIEAYDRHLTADADAYAEQVAAIPSFADQVAQALADAAAVRPDGWISR